MFIIYTTLKYSPRLHPSMPHTLNYNKSSRRGRKIQPLNADILATKNGNTYIF